MSKVDVIVLNYEGERFLRACLSALRKQTFRDYGMILVDNGSSDGSVELVRAEFPEVHVLALSKNVGFCGGNNRGIEISSSEYVGLLNNDTVVTPHWLQALVGALDAHPEVGSCASKMIRLLDQKTIDTAGDVFYSHGVGGKRGSGTHTSMFSVPERVFGACAGAVLYRRSMLDDIGLFDEDLIAYDEDVDLSFRAQLKGYDCQYVPSAVVFHHVGGSYRTLSPAVVYRSRKNMFEVLLKNMPAPLLWKYGARAVIYYLGGDIYYAAKGYWREVIRARIGNVRNFACIMRKRSAIQRGRTVSISQVEKKLSGISWRNILASRNANSAASALLRHGIRSRQ